MESSTNLFLFVGKPVRDEYGRQIGRVASFMLSLSGRVDGVLVERGDGEFFCYSSNHFMTDDDGVTLLLSTKQRAKTLCDEMPLIWRKDQALSELLEKKKIPSEMFDDLHKNFENALNLLEKTSQTETEKKTPPAALMLPEPPVMVNVRNLDKRDRGV